MLIILNSNVVFSYGIVLKNQYELFNYQLVDFKKTYSGWRNITDP